MSVIAWAIDMICVLSIGTIALGVMLIAAIWRAIYGFRRNHARSSTN